jgi:hypothetical protein
VLTDADKERARYHLGYMEVVVASSFAFAIPQATELQFMFESAITRVRPEAEFRVRSILDKLDEIECRLFRSSEELFAKRAGDLEPNLSQPDDVERELVRWACQLAQMLGVTPYPFSQRFKSLSELGGRAGNVAVRR